MYDLLIRNGKIVDGTGAPAFVGDVAVTDGKIAAVSPGASSLSGAAKREIDAQGLLVLPGWVDTHSHYDGQASWDPYLSPASNHGITTAVMGNCGVGFAPCKPEEREMLINVMEDVEDIPGTALTEGIQWEWESFPEFMDALDRRPHAIDIAAQVPHCAVRTYVMGERGGQEVNATPEEIEQMADIVRAGLKAGALGFTTSRTKYHTTRAGVAMPGTYAHEDELIGIGKAFGEVKSGTFGLVADFDHWEEEMECLKKISIDNHCPVAFVLFFRKESDWPRVAAQLEYAKQANAQGAQLIPHVGARPVNILMGWDATMNPFLFHQSYGPLAALPREERLAKLRDPEIRNAILAEDVPFTGDDFLDGLVHDFSKLFDFCKPGDRGSVPNYEPGPELSIQTLADEAGVHPREYAYDAMLRHDGTNLLYSPCFGYDKGDLSRQITTLEDENSVISLADSGAHSGVLSDVSVPTSLLSYFVRDRVAVYGKDKAFELEWAVKLHTQDTARAVGLMDRGVLAPGLKADINLVDFENLQVHRPQVVFDLPAGGRRVYQEADGYVATIVSGEIIMEYGKSTGALPGKLVRGHRSGPSA